MRNKLFLCFLLFMGIHSAKAQSVHGYDEMSNKDNVVISAGLASSNSSQLIHDQLNSYYIGIKGASSIIPSIGIHYQKSIGSRLSVRVGFSFGYTSNAFKLAPPYDSITPNYSPTLTTGAVYTKVSHGTSYLMPQIDLGYLFGPIKDMYLIEIRAGVGLQAYLGKSKDTSVLTPESVYSQKLKYTLNYFTNQSNTYGKPNAYGSYVTTIYAGLRWQKTTNDFLNHFAIGLQAVLPISNTDAGYSSIQYLDANQQPFAEKKVYFSQLSFGIKASYNLL